MRDSLLFVLSILLLAGGCSRTQPLVERNTEGAVLVQLPDRPSSVLLFDRQPGAFQASDFTYRSEWPSTDAFYSPGEVIVYSQRTTDYQRPQPGTGDYVYRRADSYRFGIGYR